MDLSLAYWIVFAVGIGLLLFFLVYYNRFVRNRIRRRESLHSIDLFLKRQNELLDQFQELLKRLDMPAMPLAETTQQIGQKALGSTPIPGKAAQLSELDGQYLSFMREARSKKQLQRQPDYNRIIEALEKNSVELNGARRYFNALVRDYNILTETMPSAVVAIMLRFKRAEFLSDPDNNSAL